MVQQSTNNIFENVYKFNGKELDEQTGYYYYGARYYDPAASIFLSVDPLAEKMPEWNPYSYTFNNPINFTDPTGMIGEGIIIKGSRESHAYNEGGTYEGKDKFIKQTLSDIEQIKSTSEGANLIDELSSSNNDFTIVKSRNNGYKEDSPVKSFSNLSEVKAVNPKLNSSDGSGGTIHYNPNSKEGGLNTSGTRDRPAFVGLAHELFHGRDSNRGELFPGKDFKSYNGSFNGLKKSEWRAVYYENIFRGQKGIPLRTHYGIDLDQNGSVQSQGPRLLNSNNAPINYNIN